jgi:hypothetical protein
MFGGVKQIDIAMLQAVAPQAVAYALAVATTDRSYPSLADWKADVEKAAAIAQNLSAHYQMASFNAALASRSRMASALFSRGWRHWRTPSTASRRVWRRLRHPRSGRDRYSQRTLVG